MIVAILSVIAISGVRCITSLDDWTARATAEMSHSDEVFR
jgi:hypothetical protein